MKVYILSYGHSPWQNGLLIYNEAKRQHKEVALGFIETPFKIVLRDIKRTKPDWILLTGSRALPPKKLKELANIAKLAIWCPDDIDPERSILWQNLKGIPSIIFTTVTDLDPTLAQDKVVWMPQYYDNVFYAPTLPIDTPSLYDICFLGGLDEKRNEWLNTLSNKNYKVLVSDRIFGPAMSDIYRQSKIAIGIWRDAFTGGAFACSDRIYKAMGAGCCYLHHTVAQPTLLFTPGKHFDIYGNTYEELETLINFYIKNDKARIDIKNQGRKEIEKNHTLKVRLPQIWKYLHDGL